MARKLIVEVVADPRGLTRGLREAEAQTRRFGQEMGSATRGAAAGSGVFSGLGRSIAFASGSYLTFAAGTAFLKDSISAAQDAATAQRSLAAQMKTSGQSFAANKDRIDETAKSYGKFGFQNDEVIKSLTVLDRGTRDINKALQLQMLAADLARAKNIGLADAANVVAKVFGGQETALRRAVPGLEKNAHGWDLIREAQQRVAGQAAANTTAAERFQATLHDTQEIIGTALLPTLNTLLDGLSKWMANTENQAKLQHAANQAAKVGADMFNALAGAIGAASFAYGKYQDLLKATGQKRGLAGDALRFLGTQIPGVRDAIRAWQEVHKATSGGGVHVPPGLAGPAGVTGGSVLPPGLAGPTTVTGRNGLQGRFNLAELRLAQAQLTKTLSDDRRVLVVEKAILEQQIAGATTLKEKTQLTQQLVGVQGQIQSIDQQNLQTKKAQTEELKKQAAALKTQADAIKSALLAQLQNRQTRINDQRAIEDAQRALHTARLIGGPQGIRAAVRAVDDARRQALIDRVSAAPARLRRSGEFSLGNVVTINVHGVTDPEKVARLVAGVLQRRARHTTTQQRGPATAAAGPH